MSLVQEILYTVSNYPGGYRAIYNIIYQNSPPAKREWRSKENTLRVTLSRLRKNGLIKNNDGKWSITHEGRVKLSTRKNSIKKFFQPTKTVENRSKLKQLIIIFDIPEEKKRYREWLRIELVGFGFNMIQKSVWLGPSLPKDFVEYLDEVGLLKFIRFFRATERDII